MAGIQLQRAVELQQRLVVHAVAAQRDAGHHVHVPVVGRAGQQIRNAVPRRLLFAARQQHVNAIEIGFGRGRVQLERLVECAPRMHHVNLPAESVTHILQFRNAQPAPTGRKLRILAGHAREQRVRAIQIARANRCAP